MKSPTYIFKPWYFLKCGTSWNFWFTSFPHKKHSKDFLLPSSSCRRSCSILRFLLDRKTPQNLHCDLKTSCVISGYTIVKYNYDLDAGFSKATGASMMSSSSCFIRYSSSGTISGTGSSSVWTTALADLALKYSSAFWHFLRNCMLWNSSLRHVWQMNSGLSSLDI